MTPLPLLDFFHPCIQATGVKILEEEHKSAYSFIENHFDFWILTENKPMIKNSGGSSFEFLPLSIMNIEENKAAKDVRIELFVT